MHSVTSNAVYPIKEKADYLYTHNHLNTIRSFPTIGWGDLPSHIDDDEIYFKEWLDYLYQQGFFDSPYDAYMGIANPNYLALVWGFTYGGIEVKDWSLFCYIRPDKNICKFGYRNGVWFWGEI